MIGVGIIANPASGKDIRRLVAHGTVFDNEEKVSIVRRALLGLEAVGVERVWIMPESFGIGPKALDGLQAELEVALLSMPQTFTQEDSTRAATLLAAENVGCIITLGGDGTNRAVAKAETEVPLVPISTGTNNVFPTMVEGTLAGMAAGMVARGQVDGAVHRQPRLDVLYGQAGETDDIALIDAAVYDERFVASRAIWDTAKIKEIVLTGAAAGNIGLSSIGAHAVGGRHEPGQGLYLRLGPGGSQVLAPIAPGLVRRVNLAECRPLKPGDEVTICQPQPCVLAFDGEREKELRPSATVSLRFNANGPRVVNPRQAIELAARAGVFVNAAGEPPF